MFFRKVRWFGNHARLLATAPCVPTTMCISTMAGPHMVVGRPPRNGALPSRGRSFPQGSDVPRGGKEEKKRKGGRKEWNRRRKEGRKEGRKKRRKKRRYERELPSFLCFLVSTFYFLLYRFYFLLSTFYFLLSTFYFLVSTFYFLVHERVAERLVLRHFRRSMRRPVA